METWRRVVVATSPLVTEGMGRMAGNFIFLDDYRGHRRPGSGFAWMEHTLETWTVETLSPTSISLPPSPSTATTTDAGQWDDQPPNFGLFLHVSPHHL